MESVNWFTHLKPLYPMLLSIFIRVQWESGKCSKTQHASKQPKDKKHRSELDFEGGLDQPPQGRKGIQLGSRLDGWWQGDTTNRTGKHISSKTVFQTCLVETMSTFFFGPPNCHRDWADRTNAFRIQWYVCCTQSRLFQRLFQRTTQLNSLESHLEDWHLFSV